MNQRRVCLRFAAAAIACCALTFPANSQWSRTAGSEGGFGIALINTPESMLIGMEAGGVYRSTNDGLTWQYASVGLTGLEPSGNAFERLGTRIFVSTGFGVDVSVDNGLTWTPTNTGLPPFGVFVAGLAVRGAVLFAGASGSGVYRSLDSGATWSKTAATPADSDVSTIFSINQFLFVGTYEGGVFQSSDDGGSWQPASIGLAPGNGMRILSFAAASGTLIVGTRGGAYRSTDNGGSWTLAASGLTSMAVASLTSLDTVFLAGTFGGGVYSSTNGGVDWFWSSTGWEEGNVRAFCARNGAIFGASYGLHPLYGSTDRGTTWTSIGSGITSELLYALAATESRVFAGAYGGVHITTDNGDTWSTPSMLSGTPITALAIKGGTAFAGTTGIGVFLSTDQGATWSAASGGLTSSASRRVNALAADSLSWYAGTGGGVYRSTDRGGLWAAANNGLTDTSVTALCAANGRLFAGTQTGVYVSANSGALWTPVTNGLPAYRVVSIVNCGGVIMIAYALGGNPSVYKSTDNGLSWNPVSNGLTGGAVIQTLYVSGNAVFGGTSSRGVWLSTNAGENWTDISQGLSGPGLKVSALTSTGGYLFAGMTKGGIWARLLSQVVSVEDRDPRSAVEVFHLAQNYPNPFNGETRIGYRVSGLGSEVWVTLKVYDVLGREVAALVNAVQEPGTYTAQWDASNYASGVYYYRLTAGSFMQIREMVVTK